jgi:hypothetical protein
MWVRGKLFTLTISIIVALILAAKPFVAQARLSEQSKLTLNGIGPIQVGMTVAEAETAAGIQLVEKGVRVGMGGCYYLWAKTGLQNLGFMVISERNKDRIARIDVYKGSRVTTLSGAQIGDQESRIKSLYPDQIKVTPHKYTGDRGGHYLTFVPKDAVDRNYRLIFETLNGHVTQFRSGKLPEVEYIEGCA